MAGVLFREVVSPQSARHVNGGDEVASRKSYNKIIIKMVEGCQTRKPGTERSGVDNNRAALRRAELGDSERMMMTKKHTVNDTGC